MDPIYTTQFALADATDALALAHEVLGDETMHAEIAPYLPALRFFAHRIAAQVAELEIALAAVSIPTPATAAA